MTATLVCGPPCSGKSTYVAQHAQPGDLVVCYDTIAQSIGSRVKHGHAYRYHAPTTRIITQLCDEIAAGQHTTAWVIRSLPDQHERAQWARRLGAQVVVCDATDAELTRRAHERGQPAPTLEAITYWRRTNAQTRISPDG